jgi:hypothetical protein
MEVLFFIILLLVRNSTKMLLKSSSSIVLALLISPSLSQEGARSQHPQIPANNQWKIGNLRIRRFLDPSNLKLGAFFEVDRVYYDPCVMDMFGDVAKAGRKCGIQATQYPILCASWAEKNLRDDFTPKDQDFYSCHYFFDGQVQRPLEHEATQWLKWRLLDLKEVTIRKIPDYSGGGDAFQSVKLQFLNGVPVTR